MAWSNYFVSLQHIDSCAAEESNGPQAGGSLQRKRWFKAVLVWCGGSRAGQIGGASWNGKGGFYPEGVWYVWWAVSGEAYGESVSSGRCGMVNYHLSLAFEVLIYDTKRFGRPVVWSHKKLTFWIASGFQGQRVWPTRKKSNFCWGRVLFVIREISEKSWKLTAPKSIGIGATVKGAACCW